MKVKIVYIGNKGRYQWHIMCPGCKRIHAMSPHIHKFNNDLDKPTFSPSLLQNFNLDKICHSFVKDGQIQFLGDCYHELVNQTIELPDIE